MSGGATWTKLDNAQRIKVFAAGLCVAIAGLWISSYWIPVAYSWWPPVGAAADVSGRSPGGYDVTVRVRAGTLAVEKRAWMPERDTAPRYVPVLAIPLRIPALCAACIATGLVVSHFWRRARNRPGCCAHCGYDLRATPGRCPECGAEAPSTSGEAGSAVAPGRP